ncbi:alpha-(1,3)-fucosyltransferase 10-like [Pectinophora gossypiella]|uniref:alpha-(1,3)-fucosyltransferase 10-like n=1 Tax=Pectinophora gossypiella TaxID=13191 RepID=UPI00214F2773|nr:alpha-(1,3)-fucosyltransferase 10-like [Pectinophora gossypiella]
MNPFNNNLVDVAIEVKANKTVKLVPAIVWYTPNIWWISLNRRIKCNLSSPVECNVVRIQSQPEHPEAYLFYAADINRFPLPRDPNIIWGLLHDESPINRMMFFYEKALNLFNYSATFSRYSDVPLPLMTLRDLDSITSTLYFVDTQTKNVNIDELAPVLYIQSNCFTATERDLYVEELMKYIKVDAYGHCLHNKELPLHPMYVNPISKKDSYSYRYHLYGQELLTFMGKYKFVIAIENGICNDYVTEKFWRTIEVGAVPIYYGSPLIRDWFPNNKSAILIEDFATPELLSQHLHYLLENDTAYEEYLVHKTLGVIGNQKLINEITVRPYQSKLENVVKQFECFVCERIHEKRTNPAVVTKKHFNCPVPKSVLTRTENRDSIWIQFMNGARIDVDRLYEEIGSTNHTPRCSNTSWW